MFKTIKWLVKIIDAQAELLACYRLSKKPKGKTLDFLSDSDIKFNNLKTNWIPAIEKMYKEW